MANSSFPDRASTTSSSPTRPTTMPPSDKVEAGTPWDRSSLGRSFVSLMVQSGAYLVPRPAATTLLLCRREHRAAAAAEGRLRVEHAEHLDQLRHAAGPSGLVARAEPGAVVAVEVLVEQD